jgi:hypothetical protein
MRTLNIIFIIFLILVFLLGGYVYTSGKLDKIFSQTENMENQEAEKPDTESCPDVLIRRGNILLLYNSKMDLDEGVNPLPFYNLDEYINFLKVQRRKGKVCPVLFLQHETTTQGEDVYRMRPNPFELDAGLPLSSAVTAPKPPNQIPVPIIDSNRDHPPYNAGNYSGFDPHGLSIGVYTKLDELHDSTQREPGQTLSDNPMDPNWGGVLYTQGKVESGKYDENKVFRPRLLTPKNTMFIPGLHGIAPPPDNIDDMM